jgi:predicted nuclease with RNAse H fold
MRFCQNLLRPALALLPLHFPGMHNSTKRSEEVEKIRILA